MSIAEIAELNKKICQWRYTKIRRPANASNTTHSRPPTWWDKHLAEQFRLKRIVLTNAVGRMLTTLYDKTHSELPADFANPAYATMLRLVFDALEDLELHATAANEAQLELFHLLMSPGICKVASNFFLLHLSSEFPGTFDPDTFSWDPGS
jgi:hypothetical protein